jgi:carboxymethylenebutenolidase
MVLKASDGRTFSAYVGRPDQPTNRAVVVLQEIFGINTNIRSVVNWFAANGYFAIAPDLFWRQEPGVELDPGVPGDRERATALMKGLDINKAVDDAQIAAATVKGLDSSIRRVGAVGYCLGGKLAYLLATSTPGVDAAVSYYGVAIQASLDRVSLLRCPMLLHIAAQDHLCPPEAQAAIRNAMAPLGDRIKILDYEGVGHAFARRASAAYNQVYAERADQATLDFLATNLAADECP